MVLRIFYTLITGEPISSYYEYVTCACIMLGILGIYHAYTRNGITTKNVVFLNSFIPISILTSATWHMANLESDHFESQESWAFCVCQIWNINLMVAVFFQLPLRQQLFFAIAGLVALVLNIEEESENPDVLRIRTYPKFIFFNIIMILVAIQLGKLKDLVIKQLTKKNSQLFETQKIILNSMPQGVILCYNDEQHFSEDQVLFVNTTITKTITSVVQHHPEMQKRLDDLQTIFPNYLKHYDFLKIPMFVRKMTNDDSSN